MHMKTSWMFAFVAAVLCSSVEAEVAVWSANKVVNPKAETGDLRGWQVSSPIIIASTAQPTRSGVVTPKSGDWFFNFASAPAAESGVPITFDMVQTIDVSRHSEVIDRGSLVARATTAYQTEDRPFFPGSDRALMRLSFLDVHGNAVGFWDADLQSPNLQWVDVRLEGFVPAGTRSIELLLRGEKMESTFVNAFFDDIELRLGTDSQTRTYQRATSISDINYDGVRDTAVLSDLLAIVVDGATGSWLAQYPFFYKGIGNDGQRTGWVTTDLAAIDVNLDGHSELAALGQHVSNGKVIVQIQDLLTREKYPNIRFFRNSTVKPLSLIVGDVDGNGMPDIGVMAVRHDGRTSVEYRDAATGAVVSSRLWLPSS